MKKYLCLGVIAAMLAQQPVLSQSVLPVEKEYAKLLHENFDAQQAYRTVDYVQQRWRLAGNTGFNESIYYVEKILQQAGFKKEVNGEADHTLTYRIEKRPLRRPAWEPLSAQLYMEGMDGPLLDLATNFNMLAVNSASTPAEGIKAEVIYAGKGTPAELEKLDVKGKIVMADGYAGSVNRNAVKAGAVGTLSFSLPKYNQAEKHVHSIQFQSIPYNDSLQNWGVLLSYAAREKLKTALEKGKVFATVKIRSRMYESEELTIVANVRGAVKPDERFVFSAHVQEPGANDNASGVGTLAEMARVTAALVTTGKLNPKRTITFLWGDEIISTGRYIKDDSVRAQGIKWGLSLDMVGEDTEKTGGSFLIEKMPDPSAIWTRGNDHHTEWGGSVLKEEQLFPHYFNDLLLYRCLNEAKNTGWVVNTNPFEGGSDHTPFLQAKIPGLLMWHFTDVYYHTDQDRIDKVSAKEMQHVGISALVTAYLLTGADNKTAISLVQELKHAALSRLSEECKLSREEVEKGTDRTEQEHIIEVWKQWYEKALDSMKDIPVGGAGKQMLKAIDKAKKQVQQNAGTCIRTLRR